MPINPNYQFINTDAADLEGKNQLLDFLRRDAAAKGMGANYGATLGYEQEMMNTVAANPPPQIAPAPQPRVAPRPVARPMPQPRPNVGAMQFPQMAPTPAPEMPEQPEMEAPMGSQAQGFGGIGNYDELPMSAPAPQPAPSMQIQPPTETRIAPPTQFGDMQEPAPEKPDLSAFEQTTLGKRARTMGFDPRQITVALSQFAAGMGNLKGKPTAETASGFYEMQTGLEAQARKEDMQLEEMALRYAPKPAAPVDLLKQELTKVQTDALRNKMQVDQELNDPQSPRSLALKGALESYVAASTGRKGFKAKPELTGADVYKWLAPVQFSIGQSLQGERATEAANAANTRAMDALDARARETAARLDNAEKERQLREKLAGQSLTARGTGAKPAAGAKPGAETGYTKDQIRNTTNLRNEYQKNPVTANTIKVNEQMAKVEEMMKNPNAATDMSLIFSFMKTLDPGSTVREGEYKSAADATGAWGRVQQFIGKAGSGQNLTPEQKRQFLGVMKSFRDAQNRLQKEVDQKYGSYAQRIGVDPQDLMINQTNKGPTIRSVHELPDVR